MEWSRFSALTRLSEKNCFAETYDLISSSRSLGTATTGNSERPNRATERDPVVGIEPVRFVGRLVDDSEPPGVQYHHIAPDLFLEVALQRKCEYAGFDGNDIFGTKLPD